MKLNLLFIGVFALNTTFSQNAPITFEPTEQGANWTWTVFENDTQTALEIVPNPVSSGMNSSAKVAKFTALQTGQPWAGCESVHGSDIGTFTLNASNCQVKILVYKSVISDVGIKFATASGASLGELKVANTLINQWEELTFNFTSYVGAASSTNIDQIIVFPDFQPRTTTNVCFFDNIRFVQVGAGLNEPMVAAPNPTVPAANVISMFSNTYTNVPVDTWQAAWSQGFVNEIQIAGNATKKYTSLNFVGIEATGANTIDLATMYKLHVDLWTPNSTTFKVKLVDFGANGIYAGGDDVEHELTLSPTLDSWNSYTLLLSDFTGLTTKNHVAQLIFSSLPGGTSVAYIDNVYFSNDLAEIESPSASKFNVFPNPFSTEISIHSDINDATISIFSLNGEVVQSENMIGNDITILTDQLKSGIYFLQIKTPVSLETRKLIKN
jgi:hypothetical protein